MASFYADENFPAQAVGALRRLGHDVLTAQEAGQANKAVPDEELLDLAAAHGRAVLTLNRRDFIALHARRVNHAGIVVCTLDPDVEAQAARIDDAVRGVALRGALIRINRPG